MRQDVEVSLTVNGKPVVGYVEARLSLADFVRNHLNLTGTHLGCEQGSCGACTVLFNGEAVRSCLILAVQASGGQIETVESLSEDGKLNPLQSAFATHHALQCGFCTPGILMSLTELMRQPTPPEAALVKEVLSGHLCRCTGYQPIYQAAMSVVACEAGGNCNDK